MVRSLIICLIGLFTLVSCTRLGSLGTKEHRFSDIPTNVVWIQLAGFQEDHLGMLYFSRSSTKDVTSLMRVPCMGKMWNFNLYQMKSSINSSFLAQMTGTKNLHNTCEDYENQPIWKYIKDDRIKKAVLEISGTEENSLLRVNKCPKTTATEGYLKDVSLWKMDPPPLSNDGKPFILDYFHAEKVSESPFKENHVYYDRSCKSGKCFNLISKNVQFMLDEYFQKALNGSLFIIRDFSYDKLLKEGKVLEAKNVLEDIEKVISYFIAKAESEPHFLFILSTAGTRTFPYPENASTWYQFDKNPSYLNKTYLSNMNSVFAVGARAENFCGIFEEYELLGRIFKEETSGRFPGIRY